MALQPARVATVGCSLVVSVFVFVVVRFFLVPSAPVMTSVVVMTCFSTPGSGYDITVVIVLSPSVTVVVFVSLDAV